MKRQFIFPAAVLLIFLSCKKNNSTAPTVNVYAATPLANTVDKTDTLRVVSYNVLNYGDGCQGNVDSLNAYFKTIVAYIHPDLLACIKMNAFSPNSYVPANLAAMVTDSVLNAVFPNEFAFTTPTNQSNDDAMNCLFYNKQKLTYVSMEVLVVNVSDFDMYKFYYHDPNLSITKDTTFLYVVTNHTQSGSSSSTRDEQLTQEMQVLRAKFSNLPNLVNLGDFNTNNSSEAGYQQIISNANGGTMMSDPSFYPDKINSYPADWTNNAKLYSAYLTTSTRESATIPNSCGTDGGGKSWYDHIFISPWLVNNSNYMSYMPNSYQTVGNDGKRLGVSVNSSSPVVNGAAPAAVINALFQFSNKYPISINLMVKANRSGVSLMDPVERN